MSYSERTVLGTSGLTLDAWGRQKTITDHSIIHGLFTLDIPQEKWLIFENEAENFTGVSPQAYSRNGALYLDSKETSVLVKSHRHPRYQPNRGHLYSSSMFLPSPERDGIREFGIGTIDSGVFFRLTKDGLFAVARTTEDNSLLLTEGGDYIVDEEGFYVISRLGSVVEDVREIDTTGVDLSKGNIYDIQMMWRGVGDFTFYINQKPVMKFNYLGTLEGLSVFNPALPAFFRSESLTQDVIIKCGCVDVTSEGGVAEEVQYSSITAPEFATNTTERVALAFRIPPTVKGLINTRDCIIARLTAYSTQDATVRVYFSRRGVVANWINVNGGFQQYALFGGVTTFNQSQSKLLATYRVAPNETAIFDNPLKNSSFYMANGDMFIITIQGKNNTLSGCNLEYGQEL
jgi:hypothetical protein